MKRKKRDDESKSWSCTNPGSPSCSKKEKITRLFTLINIYPFFINQNR